jgi:hypothetical protein
MTRRKLAFYARPKRHTNELVRRIDPSELFKASRHEDRGWQVGLPLRFAILILIFD